MMWEMFAVGCVYNMVMKNNAWKASAVFATVALALFLWRLLRFIPMYGSLQIGCIIGPGLVLIFAIIGMVMIKNKAKGMEAEIDKVCKYREEAKMPNYTFNETELAMQ